MAFNDISKNSVISIDKFHYAVLTQNTEAGYAHPAMSPVLGLITANMAPQSAEGELYADGARIYSDFSTTAWDLTMELASLPESVRAELFGNSYNPTTGKGIFSASDISPEVAIAFRTQKRNGEYTYFKFYATVAQAGERAFETKSGDINYQTETITFKAVLKSEDSTFGEFQLTDNLGTEASTFFDAVVA